MLGDQRVQHAGRGVDTDVAHRLDQAASSGQPVPHPTSSVRPSLSPNTARISSAVWVFSSPVMPCSGVPRGRKPVVEQTRHPSGCGGVLHAVDVLDPPPVDQRDLAVVDPAALHVPVLPPHRRGHRHENTEAEWMVPVHWHATRPARGSDAAVGALPPTRTAAQPFRARPAARRIWQPLATSNQSDGIRRQELDGDVSRTPEARLKSLNTDAWTFWIQRCATVSGVGFVHGTESEVTAMRLEIGDRAPYAPGQVVVDLIRRQRQSGTLKTIDATLLSRLGVDGELDTAHARLAPHARTHRRRQHRYTGDGGFQARERRRVQGVPRQPRQDGLRRSL